MPDDPLARYVEQRTGMRFSGAQRERLMRLLERACARAGLTRPAFLRLLREQPATFEALADELTVRETYFFRERGQLEWLRTMVAARAGRRRQTGRSGLRVWSAGCASGEEAFTVAMVLHGVAGPVDVLGTDISHAALRQARAARYGVRALRGVPDLERARYFREDGGSFVVRDAYRKVVRFERRNLLDGPPAHGVFDVVLCRNVLIYFTGGAIAAAAASLRDALAPDAWLVMGSADPPLEVEGLDRVATPHTVVYRPASTPADTVPAPVPASTTQRGPRLPAVALTAQPPAQDAVTVAQAAVEAVPLDAGRRYALAVLHLERGELRAAADAAAAAVFLDPSRVVAHLVLATVHQALGNHVRAQRSFRTAATLLERLPPGANVDAGEGETVQSLADVTAAALDAYAQGRTG